MRTPYLRLPTLLTPDRRTRSPGLCRVSREWLELAPRAVRALDTILFVGGYKGAGRDLLLARHYLKATEGLLFLLSLGCTW
jgi:hypothetical protein